MGFERVKKAVGKGNEPEGRAKRGKLVFRDMGRGNEEVEKRKYSGKTGIRKDYE